MSLPVGISRRAETDITSQYCWYLENASFDVAERFLTMFNLTIEKLARQPGLGRTRKFHARELTGIRSFPVGGRFSAHIIFYRRNGEELSIERLIHGARDLPRRLLEPPDMGTPDSWA
ncbi:MAG TPA: type II toxin-antitoxin system RelE/ParE family toxin [Verrucomicrobiae bacterium]|jgi:toxin ParE1/3/4